MAGRMWRRGAVCQRLIIAAIAIAASERSVVGRELTFQVRPAPWACSPVTRHATLDSGKSLLFVFRCICSFRGVSSCRGGLLRIETEKMQFAVLMMVTPRRLNLCLWSAFGGPVRSSKAIF